jgi:hypothetical protein
MNYSSGFIADTYRKASIFNSILANYFCKNYPGLLGAQGIRIRLRLLGMMPGAGADRVPSLLPTYAP